MHVLCNGLEHVHHNVTDNPTSLPLSPTLRVTGVQVRTCSYFNSSTLPLKINFLAHDGSIIPAIYKVSIENSFGSRVSFLWMFVLGW